MSREALIIVLGIVVVLTPYAGIPSDWKRLVYVFAGVILVVIGYMLRRAAFLRSIETLSGERKTESFAESHTSPVSRNSDNENEEEVPAV